MIDASKAIVDCEYDVWELNVSIKYVTIEIGNVSLVSENAANRAALK